MTSTVTEGAPAPIEPAHYPHGPSSAHRWMNCYGSINAEAPYPDTTGPAADEGTAAHWLLEQCLKSGNDAQVWVDNAKSSVIPAGEETGCLEDWPITGEMIEAVQLAIDTVKPDLAKKGTLVWAESRVRLDDTLNLPAPVGGTMDIRVYLPRSKVLKVWDFKYGKGHVVEIVEYEKGQKPVQTINEQAALYALGALYEFEREYGAKREVKWVEMGIIQPRAYHKKGPVRSYKTTPMGLMPVEEQLIVAVPATLDPDAPRTPGEKQCHFCKAKKDCPEYAEWKGENARGEFVAELPESQPHATPSQEVEVAGKNGTQALALPNLPPASAMTLEQLAAARPALKWLKDWCSDVEEEIRTRLLHDLPVKGARLAQGPGKRPWADEKAALAKARELVELGEGKLEDYLKPAELRTVAQIEKALGKRKFGEYFKPYATYIAGGPIVVDESSDKPDYVKPDSFEAEEKPAENSDPHPLL